MRLFSEILDVQNILTRECILRLLTTKYHFKSYLTFSKLLQGKNNPLEGKGLKKLKKSLL